MEAHITFALLLSLVFAPVAWSATTCDPLLVLIEGGFSSSEGRSMEDLYKTLSSDWTSVSIVLIDNEYFAAGVVVDARDRDFSKLQRWFNAGGFWPVVVVGHSLGGASAYVLAQSTPTTLLVTLDAVAHPDENDHPGVRWVNVYAKNAPQLLQFVVPWFLGDSLGEDWEHEDNADVNIPVRWTSHSNVHKLFWSAKGELYDALESCPMRPTGVGRRTDATQILDLCGHDGVNCDFSHHVLRALGGR